MSDEENTESNSDENEISPPLIPKPPESIQDISEEQRRELFQYFREVIRIEETTGHMPPPSMLAAYRPKVQDIIVDEFVQSGRQRRMLDERVFDASFQQAKRGMWFGFVLAFSLIVCGTAVILSGYSAEGLAVIAADAGVLAVVYYVDRRSRED